MILVDGRCQSDPAMAPFGAAPQRLQRARGPDLRIALVNNMPDTALIAAERQFGGLLDAARGHTQVSLELYALSSVPRAHEVRAAMAPRYGDLRDLMAARPDVLIVTGAEPRAARLTDEPYWSEMSMLVAWVRSGGVASALYSCLAAHAAVEITDGVRRRALPGKLTGVYAAQIVRTHELTAGLAAPLTPHSRYNGLDERELEASGYKVLTRSVEAGVDSFVRDGAVLEAFWQGHPEYEADTLAREIRRDLQRFASGAATSAPALPENYFLPKAKAQLERYCAQVARRGRLWEEMPALERIAPKAAVWAESSLALMRTFLAASVRSKHIRDAEMSAGVSTISA